MATQLVPRVLRHTKVWYTFQDRTHILDNLGGDKLPPVQDEDLINASFLIEKSLIKRKAPPHVDQEHIELQRVEISNDLESTPYDPSQTSDASYSQCHLTAEPLSLNEEMAVTDAHVQTTFPDGLPPSITMRRASEFLSENQNVSIMNWRRGLGEPSSPTKLPDHHPRTVKINSSTQRSSTGPEVLPLVLKAQRPAPSPPRRTSTYSTTSVTLDTPVPVLTQEVPPLQLRRYPIQCTTSLRPGAFANLLNHRLDEQSSPVYIAPAESTIDTLPQLRCQPLQRTTGFRVGSDGALFGQDPTANPSPRTPGVQSIHSLRPSRRSYPVRNDLDDHAFAPRCLSRASTPLPTDILQPLQSRGRVPMRRELTMRPSVDVGIVHTDEFRHGEVSNAELEKLLKRAESESETDAAFEAGLNDAIVTVLDANQSFYLEEDGDGKEESVSLAELLFELPPSSAVDDLLSEAETETLSPEELKMIERSVPTVALYQRMRQVNQCMPKVPNPMNPIREGTYSASWTMLLEEKDGKRFRNKLNKDGIWYFGHYLGVLKPKMYLPPCWRLHVESNQIKCNCNVTYERELEDYISQTRRQR